MKAEEIGHQTGERALHEVSAILRQIKEAEAERLRIRGCRRLLSSCCVRRALGKDKPLFELKEYHCHYRFSGAQWFRPVRGHGQALVNGVPEYTVAEGDGPVDALDAALRKALRPFYSWIDAVRLADYKVRIVDGARGTAARTRVLIVSTNGSDTGGHRRGLRTTSSTPVGGRWSTVSSISEPATDQPAGRAARVVSHCALPPCDSLQNLAELDGVETFVAGDDGQ